MGEQLNDPVRDANIKPVVVDDSVRHGAASLQGRNTSGCLWKKGNSTRSGANNVSLARKSWDQRTEERKKMASLKARMAELKEARIAAKRDDYARRKEKLERKKVNEMRSAKYQLIQNLSKTKKWHKKAKLTLTKLPAEIFYEKFKTC